MKTKKNLDKSSQSAKLKWVLPDKPQMIFLASILVLCIMILLNELLDFPAFLRGVKTNSIDWYKFATEMTAIMLVTFSGSVLLRKTESKRKRAEEALKESEEKYRALIEAAGRAGVGIIIIQDRGEGEVVFVFVNDQFCRMSGYSQSELVGRSPWNLVPREISIRLKDWYRRRHMGESLPSHYEAAGVCKNGTIMPLELSIVTMPWQGKIATVLYLRDITERKQAEEALRESEGRFRQLAENIDQVFWLTDWENDKLLYVNPSYEKLFGRSCQSAYQDRLDWYQVIHPDDRDRVKDLLVDNAKMGQNTEVKYRIIRDDGEVRWILDRNYPVRNQDGKIYRIVSIADDITERKQAERALKENEERLKLVLEGAELGTWDQNMKTGDVIRNRRWAEMLGYTLEEIEPNSDAWKALIHPDDLPVVNKIARDHETGRTQFFRCEHRMRTKLGEWKWILNCGKIIQWDSDGTPVRATGTHADITERKKAEEALGESQKRFQALTETTSDFVWEMDTNGVYTYCSPQIHELWGYKPEDMIGRTPFDLMMPEDREHAIRMFRTILESPSSFKGMETRSWDNTGRIVVLETSGVPFFDMDGRLRGYRGISRDITERKRVEETIKEERNYSKNIIETAQTIIMTLDTEGRIVNFNRYMEELSGYKLIEVKGKDWFTTFLPKCDYDNIRNVFKEAIVDIQTKGNVNSILTKEGREIIVEWYDRTLKDSKGKIIGLLAIGQDITERKRAEEALKQSEEKFRALFEHMDAASCLDEVIYEDGKAVDYRILDINPSFERITGIGRAQAVGMLASQVYDLGVAPFLDIYTKVAETGEPTSFDAFFAPIGKHLHITSFCPTKGKFSNMFIDITERKQAEEALQKSQDKLQSIFSAAPAGIGMTINQTIQELNTRLCEISGYSRQELLGNSISMVYPSEQDYLSVREEIYKQLEEEGHSTTETIWKRKNGEPIYVLLKCTPLKPDDFSQGITFTVLDITERKKAEESLRESEDKYRMLFEEVPVGIATSTIEGKIIDLNKAQAEMMGCTVKELKGRSVNDYYVYPDKRKEMIEVFKKTGKVRDFEMQLRRKDGSIITESLNLDQVHLGGKNLLFATGRDITERKRKIFSDAIDSAFDYFMLTDENGNITYANESAIRAFGYTHEEFLKLNITELDADPGIAKKALQDMVVKGKWGGEVMNIRKNKETFPCILSAFIIKDDKGNPKGTMGILRDITARKKAEDKLRESEEKLRLMFKSVTDGITVTDLSGIITECNEQTLKTHGYRSKDEILGKSAFALIAPEEHEKAMTNMKKVLGERAAINTEYTLLRTDGSQFYGELSVSGLTDVSGNLKGAIAITRDITERKRVEQELKDSYTRFSTIFHASPISIAFSRLKDSQYIDVNEAWQRITGYTREEAIGRTPIELDTWVDPARRDQLLGQLLKGGVVRDFEFGVRHRSGSISDMLLTADLITLGGESYVLTLAHDITEKKKMEAQLIQSERLAAVGTLAYGIAHEFNNILAGILGNAEFGLISRKRTEVIECLRIIMENCDRAKSITNNLLAFSTRRTVRKEIAGVADAVESVLNLVERELEKRNIKVARKFDAVPNIYCDIGELTQVVLNMVTNARDAMTPKGGTLTVEISKRKDNIEMIFSDTGCGIPNSIKSRIFEPFVTTKGALGQSEIQGTGLGLFLSYGIISRYGGKIEVESKVDKGSRFTVTIPISINQTPPDFSKEEERKLFVPENLNILLVDDEKPILSSIKSFLETEGHSVVTTTSGKKGLRFFKDQTLDLVLSDITMPDMDGLELISKLKSINGKVKLIAITGHLEEEKLESAQKAGADQILIKPFRNEDLLRIIARALSS